ncbi:MAG: CPBP family intramembrane metalloprotease [Clostridiales bacterium]|jgi:hypothetical protein|nr:CPBP family intramembrane metalloprotease [Clostridiales bacterium]
MTYTDKGSGLKKIWGMFFAFFALFILNFFVKTDMGTTSAAWLILAFCVLILSVVILVKNKLPLKKQILISFAFGLLMIAAYQGLSFTSVQTFIVTAFCSMASFSVFNTHGEQAVPLIKGTCPKSQFISIVIGCLVGACWGILNIFLSGSEPILKITLSCFALALSPAIYEEIAFRAFLFAVCLYFLNGKIVSRKERFTCYFMMIVPHVLIHTPEMFITGGVPQGIIGIFMLAVLFGLPFAVLQRKRDLLSAMVAHGIVMVIRFSFLGTPF